MHKILVTSDSHGSAYALCRVAETEPDADAMIFLGDGLRDLDGLYQRHPPLLQKRKNRSFRARCTPAG